MRNNLQINGSGSEPRLNYWMFDHLRDELVRPILCRFSFSFWHVRPLHTFRQGFRRTWIVRSTLEPTEKVTAHEFGLAVIKQTTPKPANPLRERFQAPRPDRSVAFVLEKHSNYPKSWAGIVAGASSASASVPKRGGKDGAVPASVALTTAAAAPTVRAPIAPSQIPVEARQVSAPTCGYPQGVPSDLANIMAAAIEAA